MTSISTRAARQPRAAAFVAATSWTSLLTLLPMPLSLPRSSYFCTSVVSLAVP
jgi:hypothetical protein